MLPVVVKACISYIAVYALELFFSIEIFEKIKRESLESKNIALINFQVRTNDFIKSFLSPAEKEVRLMRYLRRGERGKCIKHC